MSTHVTESGGTIEITLSGGTAARLFGAPFLLAGAYLAYNLVLGLVELVTGRAAIAEVFFGTVILLVMTAAFLVPGWLLVASRARVDIDRTSRRLVSIRDLRVYQHRQERSLDEFSAISVDRLGASRTRQSSVRSWQVELTAPTRKNQVIGLFDDDEDANGRHDQRRLVTQLTRRRARSGGPFDRRQPCRDDGHHDAPLHCPAHR